MFERCFSETRGKNVCKSISYLLFTRIQASKMLIQKSTPIFNIIYTNTNSACNAIIESALACQCRLTEYIIVIIVSGTAKL